MTSLVTSRQGIRLTDILPKAKLFGANEVFVQSCCGEWSDCESNDLFVAIVGSETDGHEFAQEAIRRGASAVVTERLLSIDRPQCIVSDSRAAYGRICQALAGSPSKRLSTIGVSGSDGKTVTCHLIRAIIKEAESSAGLSSSIEVSLGQNRNSVPAREITSPMLADRLNQMVMGHCKHAVIELSSISLAQRIVDGIEFDIAVLTNVRKDHLDYHGTSENYRRSQLRLLKYVKSNGMAVLNADDPTTHFLLDQIETPVLTFGVKQEAHVTAKVVERSRGEQTFIINAGCESTIVRSRIIGDQHVYNCLAAAATGLAMGFDLSTIANGLASVDRIPGRLERLECGQEFGLWIDAARSPFQLATALKSVRQVSQGKLWCIFSTCEQQSELERRRLGEIVERAADVSIITRTTVESNGDLESAHQCLDGFEKPGKAHVIPNRFRAIEFALSRAQPGDAVLVTGCGERPFALVGEQCWTISDRDVCQAWLYDHASMIGAPQESAGALGPEFGSDFPGPDIFNIDDFR